MTPVHDIVGQAGDPVPVDGLAALTGFEEGLAALFAESGFLDHVAASCRLPPSTVRRRAPVPRRRTVDLPVAPPVRRAGFRAGGAGGGGPGLRGIGRSAAFRVALSRIGAPDARPRRSGSAAAFPPSLTWRDPIL